MSSLFDADPAKKPLAPPTRPASDMWDREGAAGADAENPALHKKRGSSGGGNRPPSPADAAKPGSTAPHPHHDDDAEPSCNFYKKGWFWGVVVVATIVCIAAPVGVATQRRIDAEGMNPGALTPTSAKGTYAKWAGGAGAGGPGSSALLFDPVSGTFSAAGGNRTVDVSKLTCADLRADTASTPVPEGKPPAPLSSAADLREAQPLDGATWPGYDDGRTTFLSGLMNSGSDGNGWASGDLASAAYSLRAAGAKAVRVPFAFTDLFTLPPREAAHRCGSPAPSAIELADAVGAVPKDEQAAALARPLVTGQAASFCNAYVPGAGGAASSTLSRFLFTVQTLVESGHYVVLAYAPPGGGGGNGGNGNSAGSFGGGEAVVESPESLGASWGRLWASLSCMPGYADRLAGRVLVEPLATPRANGIRWGKEEAGGGKDGGNSTTADNAAAPLSDYYAAAAEAIEQRSDRGPTQAPVYVMSGTDAQVGGFAAGKPYEKRVVSSAALFTPTLEGAATMHKGGSKWESKTKDVLSGPRSWAADATERTGAAASKKQQEEQQKAAAEGGAGPAPGTVAAARAAAKQAASDGVAPIETGRRRRSSLRRHLMAAAI
jgi:hypothetical protein